MTSVKMGLRNPYMDAPSRESSSVRSRRRKTLQTTENPQPESKPTKPVLNKHESEGSGSEAEDDQDSPLPRFDLSRVVKNNTGPQNKNKEVKLAMKRFKKLLRPQKIGFRLRYGILVEIKGQGQWDELLTKEGLIVVDAYATWCGPCKAIISSFKRLKNELGDDLLHFATAETNNIDSLEKYRMKSQPTFLFYAGGVVVNVLRGCNCPILLKTIKKELDKEHKVLEGKAERVRFVDDEVQKAEEGEVEEEKTPEEEEEEIVAEEMTQRIRSSHIAAVQEAKPKEKVHVPKQVTVAIIKPDAVKAGLVDEIIKKVEEAGIEVLKMEEKTLTKEEAAEFYKQHELSEHFEQLTEFMSSGPLMTLVLSKAGETPDAIEGVIDNFRELIGPKDVNIAKEEAPDSLRAIYGTDTVMNAIHGCDSGESAARELAFFFPDFVAPTVKNKRKKRRLQRTLALIRPDALRTKKDSIIEKIKEAGFEIAMSKEMQLSREHAEDLYAEHKDQEFFETLVTNMISGPMMALCLAREEAVEGWREMLGPKDVQVANEEAPESLRAQFQVEDSPVNPLHGSENSEVAEKEIQRFFPIESTVAVIKPEVEPDQRDIIKQRIKEAGFKIQVQKEVTLTKDLASQFYHEHEGKEFFDGLTDYMSNGPTMFMVLTKEDAVGGWRALMGPTDPEQAKESAPDSIRAQFGVDVLKNAVHGSSNPERAGEVIKEFFPEVELLPDGTVKGPEEEEQPGEEAEVAAEEDRFSDAIGMEDGKIADDAITASSVLDDGHSAARARLNTKADNEHKGAWAAQDSDKAQWLQVDLGKVYRISKVATQGESGESTSHVKSYGIMYSRDGQNFNNYEDNKGAKVFDGNSDQDSIVTNELTQPLLTQHVRINPKTWNEQIALRAELYGFDADTYSTALGVEAGTVPDDAITASSELDENHCASSARLNAKAEGEKMAAWAAKDNDESQWLQVDLGKEIEVTKVSTQGKGGESTHHVTSYLLSFSMDGQEFQVYQEGGEDKVFEGNSDQETIVSQWLSLPPLARYVRLHPKTWNDHIALRVEFAGRSKAETKEREAPPEGEQEKKDEQASVTDGDEQATPKEEGEGEKEHQQVPEEGEVKSEAEEGAAEKPDEPAEQQGEAETESKPTEEGGEVTAEEPKPAEGGEGSEETQPKEGGESETKPEEGSIEEGTKPNEKADEGQAGTEEKGDDAKPEGETAGDDGKPQEGGEEAKPAEGGGRE